MMIKKMYLKRIKPLVLVGLLISCSPNSNEGKCEKTPIKQKVVIGYIAGWNSVEAENIPTDKLTHINYAFGKVIDGRVSEGEGLEKRDSANYAQLHLAKRKAKNDIKLIGSIGGWTWSGGFHDAVKTKESRELFTKTAVEYVQRYDLDGIDFDWEYPSLPGYGNPYGAEDKENFVLMLKSIRDTLNKMEVQSGKHYISSIASGGFDEYIDINNIGEAAKYLDYVNIMTYDFKGEWDTISGHHTNLYSSNKLEMSADRSVRKHVEAGVPIEKLVMGIAFYGRSWKGIGSTNHGLYQQSRIGGEGYSFSRIDSILSNSNSDFESFWDATAVAPYLLNRTDSVFVSYEDERSIQYKCEYVTKGNLKGVMFWELSEDSDDYKLLNAIDNNLK